MIDASQSLGALPLDVAALRPDFVVAVGYKWLLGPFGVGCLYVDERYRGGEPLEEIGSTATDPRTSPVLTTRTSIGPGRGGLMSASARTLAWFRWRSPRPNNCSTGVSRPSRRAFKQTGEIARRASSLGLNVPDDHGPHMLGIEVPRDAARALGARLAEHGVVASVRGDSLRIAPHLHTTPDDLNSLIAALAAALQPRRVS